jgi:hypothetical protein
MPQRTVDRRTALKAFGTAAGSVALLPWLSDEGLAAYAEIQKKGAAPRLKVLTAPQYATVEALVEHIIPADERSPGAKQARVADYVDLLLSEADADLKARWLDGLTALDAEAQKRFAKPYVRLDPTQVAAILDDVSAYETARPKEKVADPALDVPRGEQPKPRPPQVDTLLGDIDRISDDRTPLEEFFANTKHATIHGYYTSEIGIHQELHYKGNKVLLEFVGCGLADGRDCPQCGQKAGA